MTDKTILQPNSRLHPPFFGREQVSVTKRSNLESVSFGARSGGDWVPAFHARRIDAVSAALHHGYRWLMQEQLCRTTPLSAPIYLAPTLRRQRPACCRACNNPRRQMARCKPRCRPIVVALPSLWARRFWSWRWPWPDGGPGRGLAMTPARNARWRWPKHKCPTPRSNGLRWLQRRWPRPMLQHRTARPVRQRHPLLRGLRSRWLKPSPRQPRVPPVQPPQKPSSLPHDRPKPSKKPTAPSARRPPPALLRPSAMQTNGRPSASWWPPGPRPPKLPALPHQPPAQKP